MKSRQKKVLAINDISCVGRCSLTVNLPMISSCGIECSIIPTAILSTHTGGFNNYTYFDFSKEIMPIVKHWNSFNRTYDAVFTGFLASIKQVKLINEIIETYKDKSLIIVDPSMADNGKLYKVFNQEFVQEMKLLCFGKDILLPNITEACLLTNTLYKSNNHDEEYIDDIINKLGDLNISKVVITGIMKNEGMIGTIGYDYENKEKYYFESKYIDGYFHGTGDVFSSAFIGAYMNDVTFEKSIEIAIDITYNAIVKTVEQNNSNDFKFGLEFEKVMPSLIERINDKKNKKN